MGTLLTKDSHNYVIITVDTSRLMVVIISYYSIANVIMAIMKD